MRRLKIVIAVGILSMTPMPFRAQKLERRSQTKPQFVRSSSGICMA